MGVWVSSCVCAAQDCRYSVQISCNHQKTLPLLELALCTPLPEQCETALPFQDLGGCSRTSCPAGRLGHCPGAFCAISSTEGSRTAPIDHLGFFLPRLQQISKVFGNLLVLCMVCQPRRSFLMLSTACRDCDLQKLRTRIQQHGQHLCSAFVS